MALCGSQRKGPLEKEKARPLTLWGGGNSETAKRKDGFNLQMVQAKGLVGLLFFKHAFDFVEACTCFSFNLSSGEWKVFRGSEKECMA